MTTIGSTGINGRSASLVRAGDVWNRETFEYYASVIRKQPATRSRIIEGCSRNGLVGLSDRSRTEVERDSGMPPEKAAVEARRPMVEGIAFGSVTYEDYRAWADAPDDKRVVFPTTSKGR